MTWKSSERKCLGNSFEQSQIEDPESFELADDGGGVRLEEERVPDVEHGVDVLQHQTLLVIVQVFSRLTELRHRQSKPCKLLDAASVAPAHGGKLQRPAGHHRREELLDDVKAVNH